MTARNDTARDLPAPLPREGAAFTAQALGQGGERRGLKGGPPVLSAARTAYLRTQWSGEDDRRPAAGLVKRASA